MAMIDLADILKETQCVLSVIGPHAGESMSQIYERKTRDILTVGKTFWVISCDRTVFNKIHDLCMRKDLYVIFIAPASKNGARPATTETVASGYKINDLYTTFPREMSPVTGKINGQTAAFVLDELQLFDADNAPKLDLWNYMDAVTLDAVRFCLGRSTRPCFLRMGTEPQTGMKSRYRRISAIGHLTAPFCVRPVK